MVMESEVLALAKDFKACTKFYQLLEMKRGST